MDLKKFKVYSVEGPKAKFEIVQASNILDAVLNCQAMIDTIISVKLLE